MSSVWMFPGQGSQSPGMGRQLFHSYQHARRILAMAEECCGRPLDSIRRRGPDQMILSPSNAEMLLAANGIGYADLLISMGHRPDFVAGYSAGEVPALYLAGVLTLEDALRVAKTRGDLFEEYVASDCRMITVTGMEVDSLSQLLAGRRVDGKDLYLAAHNGPEHGTVVGGAADVMELEGWLLRNGYQISQVRVAGKWHSPHLNETANRLMGLLEEIPFQAPKIPIYTSASGRIVEDPQQLKRDLCLGVCQSVLWQDVIEDLVGRGVEQFIECGSGRVLFGLMRWNLMADHVEALCVEDRNGGLHPLRKLQSPNKTEYQG